MTTDVYTTTLTSGSVLAVHPVASFGQILVTGLALILIFVVVLDTLHRLAYRE